MKVSKMNVVSKRNVEGCNNSLGTWSETWLDVEKCKQFTIKKSTGNQYHISEESNMKNLQLMVEI